jgi:hypothetical protein
MSCLSSGIGCTPTTSLDCLQGNWSIEKKETATLFRSNEIITATGVIDFSHATKGLTRVTLTFWIGSVLVTTYTLTLHQCLGFTVSDFELMKLEGNGSLLDIASGHFSLTPRYRIS